MPYASYNARNSSVNSRLHFKSTSFLLLLLLAHVKSVNGSEYYCEGLHKTLNPEYATTPCLQHGVVAVDGKLIPFAYPTGNSKQAILWNGQTHLPHSSTEGKTTTMENGTIRLNTNPMNRVDHDKLNEAQENFYHTLTPFNSQYEEHSCASNQPSLFDLNSFEEKTNKLFLCLVHSDLFGYPNELSTCPIHHHHLINYPSDTFPLKTCLNNKTSFNTKKLNGNSFHESHHHHGTCQRHLKPKRIVTPVVPESMKLDSKDSLHINISD